MSTTFMRILIVFIVIIIITLGIIDRKRLKKLFYELSLLDVISNKRNFINKVFLYRLLNVFKYFFIVFYFLLILQYIYLLYISLDINLFLLICIIIYPFMLRILFGLQLWAHKVVR